MPPLTGRERLLKTFRREPVDRVPIGPFLWYNNVYEMFQYVPTIDTFFDPPDFDPIQKFVEYCDYFGFDAMHTLAWVWDAYNVDKPWENWDVTVTWEGSGDERRKIVDIRTPGGDLRMTQNWRRSSTYLIVWANDEYLIKTRKDFELLAQYGPPADHIDTSLVTRARQAVGDKGLVDAPTHGVFNCLALFRRLDDVMMDPVADEGWYRAMMDFFTAYLLKQVRAVVAAGADIYEIGANMATSAVGPQYFQKYVAEYEHRLAKGVHECGAFNIYHNCGDAAKIMRLYNDLDIDCWGYLTPPPFADVELDDALRIIRPDMILRGNIDQVEFLVKATPAEIKARVKEVLDRVRPRGNFILSTTDFFFDGCPYENIMAFADAGREYGVYA
jgi:uroporphyrinogen-III decarboxylase